MLTAFWGELKSARVRRLAFFRLNLVLLLVALLAAVALLLALAGVEWLLGGPQGISEQQLAEQVGLPLVLLLSLGGAGLCFASLNLCAKRCRDIGLPGWRSVLSLAVAVILASLLAPSSALILHGAALLGLQLAPSGLMLRRRRSRYGERDD